jgi:hypothetical protein
MRALWRTAKRRLPPEEAAGTVKKASPLWGRL